MQRDRTPAGTGSALRGRPGGRITALVAVLILLLLPLAAAPVAGAATRYPDSIRFGRAQAQRLLRQSGASSMSLALLAGDRVVWRQTFGYADVQAQRAPALDTMYGIGSVSKVVCAAAVMTLVDQGRVDLDAPVVLYVPAFHMLSPDYADITVRMLLDHSSGLPGTTYTNWVTTDYFTGYHQQVLDSLAQQWLKATPGSWSVYCNDGFTLAEMVIQSVTGQTYADYVEDAVFAPLGMRHSTFPMQPFADGTYARAYLPSGEILPRESVQLLGSGGVYSTPTDMTRLARMFLHHGELDGVRVLSREAVDEMTSDQTVGNFDPSPSTLARYGLGWDTVAEPAFTRAGLDGWAKNGGSSQYGASFVISPKAKLAVMASGAPVVTAYLDQLSRGLLLRAAREQGTISRLPGKAPTTAPPAVRASRAQLEAMTGCWANYKTIVRISRTPGRPQALTTESYAHGAWTKAGDTLRLRTDGRFHSDGSATGYRIVRGGNHTYLDGTYAGLDGYSKSHLLFYQRIAAREPAGEAWQRRAGGVWLAVNEQKDSAAYWPAAPLLMLDEIPGLPGYVAASTDGSEWHIEDASRSDDVARLFLQIPTVLGRDQEDFVIVPRGGEEWARWDATLFRPLATVPALANGDTTITIGAEGYAEWRAVEDASDLRISDAAAWYLYDDAFRVLDKGAGAPADVAAPAGTYLIVFGDASSVVHVTATPAT